MTSSAVQPTTATAHITRRLLVAIGIYSILLVGFLNCAILFSGSVKGRAIFHHGWKSTLGGVNPTYFRNHIHEVFDHNLEGGIPNDDEA